MRAGRTNQQDIGLFYLQGLQSRLLGIQHFLGPGFLLSGLSLPAAESLAYTLVVIVHGHCQGLLGIVLSYHILVQKCRYLLWRYIKGLT